MTFPLPRTWRVVAPLNKPARTGLTETRQLPSRLTVLVVEDQQDTAESTAELLTLFGCEARVANNGEDALKAARVAPPDVVLLDIALPGINGWEVARRLRDQAVGRQPFLVAVTGFGGDDDRWRSADAGVDIHLVKPADPVQLLRLLAWIQGVLAPSDWNQEPRSEAH